MQYYSTNHLSKPVSLKQAITHSEAADGGLYMPERLPVLPKAFINNLQGMSASDLAYIVNNTLFGDDIPSALLKKIGDDAISFPMPAYEIEPGIFVVELFHGPTLTVKDIGARFLGRMLRHLHCAEGKTTNILITTTGNSGNAIANVFHKTPGVNVFVLYPKGLNRAQFDQINAYGDNIHTIEVNGHLDHCATMINRAYLDPEMHDFSLTSANSFNIGSLLPNTVAYFNAAAQVMRKVSDKKPIYMSIPAGSCGNIVAAYIAKRMGMPVDGIIGACNSNAGFAKCLERGIECMRDSSVRTLAYSLDTTRSANMPRLLDMCNGDLASLRRDIVGESTTDAEIANTINDLYERTGYLLDPHGAVAYNCLKKQLPAGATGVFFATSHPTRSLHVLQSINRGKIKLPPHIKKPNFCSRAEVTLPPTYGALRKYLKYTAAAEMMQNRV